MAASDLAADLATGPLYLAARRAYERGRRRSAFARGAGAALLAMPAFLACGTSAPAAACLAGLAVAVAVGRLRGGALEEGTRTGLVAGILPCFLPVVLRLLDPALCDLLFSRGPWLCAAVGVASGVMVGLRGTATGGPGGGASGPAYWSSAVVTLALAASLGCIPAGLAGFLGLAAGAVAGAAPLLVARRAAA